MATRQLFDVEHFRHLPQRTATARQVDGPTLVLGSTQRSDIVSRSQVHERGVEVVRRRGGGGAVLLRPGDQLWLDAWIPRDDPLWRADVTAAAAWVGAWWAAALGGAGVEGCQVHEGRAEPGDLGHLVCFAGRGPGEVFSGARKLVGLSQWRSREGALFLTCAYGRWQPAPLAELLAVDGAGSAALVERLTPLAVGLDELAPAGPDLASLGHALLSSFPAWGTDGGSAGS